MSDQSQGSSWYRRRGKQPPEEAQPPLAWEPCSSSSFVAYVQEGELRVYQHQAALTGRWWFTLRLDLSPPDCHPIYLEVLDQCREGAATATEAQTAAEAVLTRVGRMQDDA